MKHKITALFFAFLFILGSNLQAFAQEGSETDPGGFDLASTMQQVSAFNAGFGLTNIDGQNYIGFRIQPELVLGKLGVGIDAPLLFSLDDGKIRLDEYKGGVGLLRMFRYVRWGVKKQDPVYLRAGDLTGEYLGYGLLINNYTNATSFEKRKVGLAWDILIKDMVGIEGLYSDFNAESFNLFGIRPYVRPLANSGIPILKTMEVGVSYVTDRDATKMNITDSTEIGSLFTEEGTNAFSADMGVWFINNRFIRLSGAVQYGQLFENKSDTFKLAREAHALMLPTEDAELVRNYGSGSGFSVGLDLKVNVIANILRVDARIDRLWYSDYFMPQFFDAYYEMNKDGKLLSLSHTKEKKGIYGSLSASLINKIMVRGSLLIPDGVGPHAPGFIELTLDGSQLMEKVIIQGTYIKGGLLDFSANEIFTFDERSLTNLRVAYKLKPWLLLGVDYKWTYARTENDTFEAVSHFNPYFGISLPFGQGNSNSTESTGETDYGY